MKRLALRLQEISENPGESELTAEDRVGQAAVLRGELRRKLHALGAGGRSLRLDELERSVADALGMLDRSTDRIHPDLQGALDALQDVAGGTPTIVSRENVQYARALWFGAPEDSGCLALVGADGRAYACDFATDAGGAFDFVRDSALDVVIIDADAPDAYDLASALLDDPSTEAVPLVVVGKFIVPSERGQFLALGPSAVVSKGEGSMALRHACDEALRAATQDEPPIRPLGDLSVTALAGRLCDELRAELTPLDDSGEPVPFDVGTDILAPLWGAVARIRESVSMRTHGRVRFRSTGPLGAHFMAPSLESDVPRGARNSGTLSARHGTLEVDLTGKRVLVVDDDPAVTWFVADAFRSAGCIVDEALDGETALLRAYTNPPDLIVTDVLMPRVDGITLCRVLKKDALLRDRPIIVLSWKEDLLQRVRELGMPASGFLRKESDDLTLLANARELLRTTSRIETRIREPGEVRGRLDGLCATTLLTLVGRLRPSARITVRDASFLFEIQLQEGVPVSATRSRGDGTMLRGDDAIAALLGVSAGRFWIGKAGTPDAQALIAPTALAQIVEDRRRVLRALGLHDSSHMGRIVVDEQACADFLRASPPQAITLVQKLATGESPKNLLLSGKCDVLFLEEILCALAVRGAIRAVEDPGGHELSIPIVLPDFSKLEIEGELRSALPPSVAPKAGPLELSGSERPTFEPLTATDVESQEEVSSPIPNEPMTFAKMPDDEVSAPAPAAVELSAEPRAHVSERTDVDGVPLVRLMEPGRVTTDVDHTLYAGSVPAPALEPEPVFSPPTLRAEGVSAPMTPAITPTSMKPVIEPTPDDASLRSVSVRLDMHEADSPSALPMEPVSSPPPPMARDASLPPKRGARFVHSALIFAGAVAAGIVLMQSLGDKGAAAPPPAQATDFGNQPTITYKTISSGAPEGRVEVEASGPNVRIDGIDRGTGPDLVLTLPPGSHRIDQGEGRSAWSFEVRPGSIARVRLPSGP